MGKFIAIILAVFAIEAGIILVGTGTAHADSQSTTGDVTVYAGLNSSYRDTNMCTFDYYRGGQACGTVRLYDGKSHVVKEGRSQVRYIQCETGRKVQYLGWSRTNMSNSDRYIASRSTYKPSRFHLYRVTTVRVGALPGACDFPNI